MVSSGVSAKGSHIHEIAPAAIILDRILIQAEFALNHAGATVIAA